MPWRRFGVPIVVIVLLFALGRSASVVVDWAWFSSIGYVGVFWTAFVTKAVLFVVVFAVSTLFLWANAALAYRFAARPGLRLPAVFDPGVATFQAFPGPLAGRTRFSLRRWYGVSSSWPSRSSSAFSSPWARPAGGTSSSGSSTRRPTARVDPLFVKDIGFYLFSLPALRRAQELAAVDPPAAPA